MSLKPCRACQNEVDTSAISCPTCGATRPAHRLSLQTYNLIILAVQIIVGLTILYFIASAVWKKAEPFVNKANVMQMQRQQEEQEQLNNNEETTENSHNEHESESESENESDNENESE